MPRQFIDSLDDEALFVRQEDFSGGMDGFTRAVFLPDSVCQSNKNMVQDDSGLNKTRPGFDPVGGSVLSAAVRVQELEYFDIPGTERIYASINNTLRSWSSSDLASVASWATVGSYPFGANTIVAMKQGANVLYCSDGTNQWQSYDGAAWSGALGSTSIDPPVGATLMVWHTQRMFASGVASLPDTIYVSDIGSAGTGEWPADNSFRVGRGEGEAIVGLVSFRGFELIVGKEGSIYTVNAHPAVDVANWPITRITNSVGFIAAKCAVMHGDNIFFLAGDGIRTISPNDGTDVPYEVSPPLSEPMQPYIKRINWSYAYKSCAWKYRQYLFFAIPLDDATEPNYVLAFNVRTLKWMAYWTGLTPTVGAVSRFAGVERMIFGDSAGYVNFWKDYQSEDLEATYEDNGSEISSLARSKGWNFLEPVNFKDPTWAEWRFENSAGNATLRVYLDGAMSREWSESLANATNSLPIPMLPFDLAVIKPKTIAKSLDGLPEFNEAFIEVEASSKKMALKNWTMGAFMNTHANE